MSYELQADRVLVFVCFFCLFCGVFGGMRWSDPAVLPRVVCPTRRPCDDMRTACAPVSMCCGRLQAASLDQQEAAALAAGERKSGSLDQNPSSAATGGAEGSRAMQGEPLGDAIKRERAFAAADTAMAETMAEVRSLHARGVLSKNV